MNNCLKRKNEKPEPHASCKFAGQKAFTLLEVMFALSILAIALVAVFQLQSQGLSMLGQARFETTASLLAKGKMAELEIADSIELTSGTGEFGDDYPGYSWEVIVESTPLEAMVKLTVLVTNDLLTRNNTYHLELFRTVATE